LTSILAGIIPGVKDTLFSIKKTLNIRGKLYALDHPLIMGILNITPDSFYSNSRFTNKKNILHAAEKMLKEGAFALDVGGYSSRPGATDIPEDEELKRVIPVIEELVSTFPEAVISVDTFRAKIAEMAIETGASIINDISGGELDPYMWDVAARHRVPYILMHMRGTPQTMKQKTDYHNLFKEITVYFNRKIHHLKNKGVSDIILDPGFGFAKTIGQNYELLTNLSYFNILGFPLMAGLSRKSMIYRILKVDSEAALNGTTVINTLALLNKASILRVHDVNEAREIVNILKNVNFDISN
jgi:dihydropteroate synthase